MSRTTPRGVVVGVLRERHRPELGSEIGVARILQVRQPEPVVGRTAGRGHEQPTAVVRGPATYERGGIVGAFEHHAIPACPEGVIPQLVVGIRLAQAGVLRRAAEARVVESPAVLRPGHARELHVQHDVRELVPGGQVANVDVLEVRASRCRAVAQGAPIGRNRPLRHGDRAVGRERVGIEHRDRRGSRDGRAVQDRLPLQSRVATEPELPRFAYRNAHLRVVPERREAGADRVALRQFRQIGEGQGVLGVHPAFRGRGVEILEPAIGIRHVVPEVVVADAPFRSRRVLQLLRRRRGGEHRHGEHEIMAARAHGGGS